jgi:putative DNA primase/helicase
MQLHVALFRNYYDNAPERKCVTWKNWRTELLGHRRRKTKDGPMWSPVQYPEGVTRANVNVVALYLLVLDFDDGATPEALKGEWERWEYVVHSSHSSRPEAVRWRAIFPFAAPVANPDWPRVFTKLAEALGQGHIDTSCKDQSRMYYLPAFPPGEKPFSFGHEGEFLDPADFSDPEPPPARVNVVLPRLNKPVGNGRVKSDVLLAGALAELGQGRNNRGLWLACQLRDNEYSEGEAEGVMLDYVRHVPETNSKGDRFTDSEGLSIVRKAYSRPAREPWEQLRDVWHEPPLEEECTAEEAAEVIMPEMLPADEEVPEIDESLAQDVEDAPTDKTPSELTLARRWAREVKERFAFFEGSQWWEYGGGKWTYSSTEQAEAEVQRFMERLRFNGVDVSVTATKVAGVLKLARPHLGVHRVTELNSRPTLIPLRNGVYDAESGRLLPHNPEFFLTNQLPFDFDNLATCPRWLQFLGEVMLTATGTVCDEWIGALQEWFGYCLSPDNSAQVSMVWVGEGRNGKGVAARALECLLGPSQCCAVPVEQLHDPYHRAELQGKLVGFVNEPDPRAMLKNGAYFKAITGGDTISARRPTEKVFSFVPFCRLVISTNSVPGTRDLSHGYFRRLMILEWRRNFSAEDADPHLDGKIRDELPGIFNWAVEGLKRFRERGSKFAELAESDRLLAAYRLSEDPLRQFIFEECEAHIHHWTWFREFYDGFRQWAHSCGHRDIGTKQKIGRRLDQLGIGGQDGRKGDRVGAWRSGLQIKADSEFHPDNLAAAKESKGKLNFG